MKGIKIVWISLALLTTACHQEISQKPNVLFILVDDLGWADLGFSGSAYYQTPNIDRLASEGAVFTNAYSASPVCSPARAAILSGKSPAELNLTDYIPGNRHWGPHKDQKLASHPFKLQLDLEETTMAEGFKDAGYITMFAGKWHVGEKREFYPEHQGFDINVGGNSSGHPAGGYFAPYNNPQLADGPDGEYLTDRLTDEVIAFMKANKEKPFFAFLSYYTVHLPLHAKPEKVDKYEEKLTSVNYHGEDYVKEGKTWFKQHQNIPKYAAMVESMDENVGRLLYTLEELRIDDNTIVVYTSDNGGMATSNITGNIPTSNLALRAGKGHLYEGGIRVPLIFRGHDVRKEIKIDFPVSGTDLFPTIIDLAGIKLLSATQFEGISLINVLNGKGIEERPIFWHYPHYSGGLGGRPSGAVRYGNYKLIEFYEDMHVELYDLKNDMSEVHDLSKRMPERTEQLKSLLHAWRKDLGAQMPFENPHYVRQE